MSGPGCLLPLFAGADVLSEATGLVEADVLSEAAVLVEAKVLVQVLVEATAPFDVLSEAAVLAEVEVLEDVTVLLPPGNVNLFQLLQGTIDDLDDIVELLEGLVELTVVGESYSALFLGLSHLPGFVGQLVLALKNNLVLEGATKDYAIVEIFTRSLFSDFLNLIIVNNFGNV